MSVLEGSQYFTTHPPVLTAPCAPVDPVRERDPPKPKLKVEYPSTSLPHWRLKTNKKRPQVVDPLSFHALTFNYTSSCLEHSDLLTVTTAGESLERVAPKVPTSIPKEAFGRLPFPHATEHRRFVRSRSEANPG